ncbi:carbohydrate binding domain-containing protein [Streptomyces sp. NPDC044948]|uniref:carbohydrate binding domain-containing protein n=1 Tax=Streptomyces sp. NPDC044948 TaxID=3157092 RepID=UPI0033C393DF
MPQLPPPVWADLHYDGVWNDITEDVRVTTAPVTVTRGLSSESSSEADPTTCTCDLDSRDDRYAPRNPMSPLYGLIGRNTGFRWGYDVGSPWARIQRDLARDYASLFVNPTPALNVTGDFDLRIDVSSDYWWLSQMLALRAVESTNSHDWAFEIVGGRLTFLWCPDGLWASRISHQSTEIVKAYTGQRLALRVTLDVDNGRGGHEVRFYTGRTVDDEEWTLLGDPVTGTGTTSLYTGNAYMELGDGFEVGEDPNGSSLPPLQGNAYALQLRDGIGGTVKVDMKTSQAALGATTFVDDTGVTWRLGGVASLTNRHIRMAGEIPAWPPTRDLSGNDNIVSISPTGVTRRMDAGNKPQDSALRRFIRARGALECWPLTDGPDSTAPQSMMGGRPMEFERVEGDTLPTWEGGTLADWIEPVIGIKSGNNIGIMGYTPRLTTTGDTWSMDVILTGGAVDGFTHFYAYDTGAGTDADPQVRIYMILGADTDQATLIRHSETTNASSEALLGNFYNIGIFDERPHHVRLTFDTGASGVHLWVDGVEKAYAYLSAGMKPVSQVRLAWGTSSSDRAAGYVTYWDENAPSPAEMYDALTGFQGETAGARIERLASESGYTASVTGAVPDQQLMGIQDRAKLLALLNDASRTDFGYLLDARDRTEVIHRGGSTLWNQPPALVLDYSAGVIGAPFRPVDDDKLTENDVSVRRAYGSVPARHVLEEGELSVQDPPLGVGRYDHEFTYSLATDGQADQVASMRLHLGTYNGVRYTRLTLNLANSRVFAMIDEILRIDVGDKIRLTNLPADHGPDDVDVLVHGYEETAGPDEWTLTFNCQPAEPWTAGVVDSDTHGRVDTDGCELVGAIDATETAVEVVTTAGLRWADSAAYGEDLPFDVRTGGETMRVVIVGPVLNANPAFEAGTADWTAAGGATFEQSNEVTRRGGYSGKLTTGAGSNPRAECGLDPVTAGSAYTAAGWLYAPVALPTAAALNINWFDSSQTYLSTSGNASTLTAGEWTRLAQSFTAPAAAAFATVVISISGTPGAGYTLYAQDTVLIDDAALDSPSQTLHVVRSVNGIVKAHPAGQPLALARPVYVAL